MAELRQGMIGELEAAATVGVELPEADRETLLGKVVNIYVTQRGFLFAATYLEMYKQWKKKKQFLQKRRPLRGKVG